MKKTISIFALTAFIIFNPVFSLADTDFKRPVTNDYILEQAKEKAAKKALLDKAENQKNIDPCESILNPELYNTCVENQKLYGVDIRAKQEEDDAKTRKRIDKGKLPKKSTISEIKNPDEPKEKVYSLREILGQSKGANAEEVTIDKLRKELWEVKTEGIPEDQKKTVPLIDLE